MNEPSRDNKELGRLIRPASRSLAPILVDCNTWDAGVPADQWSTGKLASVPRLAHAGNQGAFVPADTVELEIALHILPGAKAGKAFDVAAQVFAAVLAHNLGHGLAYDRTQSGAEGERTVIVLTPGQIDPQRGGTPGKARRGNAVCAESRRRHRTRRGSRPTSRVIVPVTAREFTRPT